MVIDALWGVSVSSYGFSMAAEALLVEQSTGKPVMLRSFISSPQGGNLAGCRSLFSSSDNNLKWEHKRRRLVLSIVGVGNAEHKGQRSIRRVQKVI